jgi:hypothetical protein
MQYVRSEFEEYLKCGRLEYGFLRVRCENCHHGHMVAFSWPLLRIYAPAAFVHPARHHAENFNRGLPDRTAVRGEWQKTRRMTESAALLVDDVLPHEPIRQWVLSFPFQLRFLFASYPHIMGKVLGIVYRTLATHITRKAGYNKEMAQTGAVTLIQRLGSALTKSPGAILNSRRAGGPKSFRCQFYTFNREINRETPYHV